ncbi:MAG: TonB-dependent receptor [Betaproteobacteria bacterium]
MIVRSHGYLALCLALAVFAHASLAFAAEIADPVEPSPATPAPRASPPQDKKTDLPAIPASKLPPDTKPQPKPQQIDKIEIKTSQDNYDARREDTATKIVVTEEEIIKYGDTQLADVLKRQPGITVTGTDIRMRGLGSGYTQILLNGERAPPGFSLDTLSPSMVERIEILRAATAEFSTQSIAGTINVILKKRVVVAQRELKLGYGQGRGYRAPNANFVVSNKDGDFSYSVNGYFYGGRNIDYLNRGSENGADVNGTPTFSRTYNSLYNGLFNGAGISPRLNWTFAGGDTLTWQGFANYNLNRGTSKRRYEVARGPDVPFPVTLSTSHNENELARSDLNWVHKFAGGAKLDLKFGLNVGFRNNDFDQHAFNRIDSPILDSLVNNTARDAGFTFTGKYSTPIVEGHSLVAGWDTGVSKRTETQNQRDTIPGSQTVVTYTDFDASVLKLAAFAQDEWNVTPEWSVYLGLRWEGLTTTSEGNTYDEVRNRSSVWSPLMQTLYKLPGRKGEQVRLALTRTYKAPNTNSLIPRNFKSLNNSPTETDYRGNPDLKPELATGIDVAYEKFWDQGAMFSVSAALRRISDFNRTGLLFSNGRWLSTPINDGIATTKSLEFDAKFPIQTLYKAAPPIDFRFNMNRNWSTVASVPGPNNRLAQQTPFSSTLGLDYRMKGGIVVAGTSYSFKSGGDVRISENQTRYVTPKRELELYALWKYTPKLNVRLTMSNLLRQDYRSESAYFDQVGTVRRADISPSSMNVRLNMELKF